MEGQEKAGPNLHTVWFHFEHGAPPLQKTSLHPLWDEGLILRGTTRVLRFHDCMQAAGNRLSLAVTG
jgi:hypothetical protein